MPLSVKRPKKTYIVYHDSDNIHEHSIISVGVNKNITLTLVSTVIIALGCPNYTYFVVCCSLSQMGSTTIFFCSFSAALDL